MIPIEIFFYFNALFFIFIYVLEQKNKMIFDILKEQINSLQCEEEEEENEDEEEECDDEEEENDEENDEKEEENEYGYDDKDMPRIKRRRYNDMIDKNNEESDTDLVVEEENKVDNSKSEVETKKRRHSEIEKEENMSFSEILEKSN